MASQGINQHQKGMKTWSVDFSEGVVFVFVSKSHESNDWKWWSSQQCSKSVPDYMYFFSLSQVSTELIRLKRVRWSLLI